MFTSEISSHHDLRKKHAELTWVDGILKHFIRLSFSAVDAAELTHR